MMCGGCLATPGPAASIDASALGDDGGDDDGGDVDAAADANPDGPPSAARCRPGGLPTPQPWPPAGVDVRHVRIADIDGDDVDDLVISVAGQVPMSTRPAKVFVLYGPVSSSAPMYHVTVDVDAAAELQPYAMSLDDADGDGCADLTVAGPPTSINTLPFVATWAHDHSAQAWTGVPDRAQLSFVPDSGPVMIVWADLTVNAALDLAVADLNGVDFFIGSTPTNLGGRISAPAPASCIWGYINALATQPRPGGRNRLIAFAHYQANTIEFDDVGTVTTTDNCTASGAPITRGSAVVDLDSVAPLDLISGGGGFFGAHILAGSAAPVSPTTGAPECANRGGIEGFAVADMGGTAALDAVTIDQDDQAPVGSYACLVSGFTVTSTAVTRNAQSELWLGTGRATTVAIGDVNGAVRGWIVDLDGTLHCVQRNAGANTLEPC